jgi:mevalonate kinase
MIECSAPGKIILFGEHFVVKGKPALASAINLRAKVKVNLEKECIRIFSKKIGFYEKCGEMERGNAIEKLRPYIVLLDDIGEKSGIRVIIDSNIPVGAGLGSSAATSVALSACLRIMEDGVLDKKRVYTHAMRAERVFHAKPSGIDPLVSVEGGLILFYNPEKYVRLSMRLPKDVSFILVDTGIPRSTGDAVLSVLRRYDRNPRIMKMLYDASEVLIDEVLDAIKEGESSKLGELMLINQGMLNSLGVSFPEAELIINTAVKNGAMGGKITGAGLGGFVLILAENNNLEKIREKLREIGFRKHIIVRYENVGVTCHK